MKYLVGIDPGFQTMGVAVLDLKTKELKLNTGEYEEMIKWVNQFNIKECGFVVENPDLASNIWNVWPMVEEKVKDYAKYQLYSFKESKGQAPVTTTMDEVRSKFSIAMRQARSVGENSAAAKLLLRMLEKAGGKYIEISPTKRQNAKTVQAKAGKGKVDVRFLTMPTKTTSEQFEEFCGYKGSSNEHNRDAATLITGRSETWFWQLHGIAHEEAKKVPKSYPKSTNAKEFLINHKLHEKRDPI